MLAHAIQRFMTPPRADAYDPRNASNMTVD
jgi:hypothetical protein